jgi:hypothetical protein
MENPTHSNIPRCPHSVFFPDHLKTDKNSACTLCTPILVSKKDKTPVVLLTKHGWTSKKKASEIDLDEDIFDHADATEEKCDA